LCYQKIYRARSYQQKLNICSDRLSLNLFFYHQLQTRNFNNIALGIANPANFIAWGFRNATKNH